MRVRGGLLLVAVVAALVFVGIALAAEDPPTPVITGTPRVGETLTASGATIFKWQRCDPGTDPCAADASQHASGWQNISGQQSDPSTYTLTLADAGMMIRVLGKDTVEGTKFGPSSPVGPVASPPASVRVIKDLVPASDPGTFDLEIDDTTFTNGGNGYGDGGTTGFQQVTAGSHTVDEVAHTGTDGSDYVSSVSCDSDKGGDPDDSSHTFTVAAGDQVTCTITNSRNPEIRVIKDLVPASDPGTFDLEIDDTTFTNGGNGYGDGGTTGFQQVTAGSHTVDEVAHTGTDGSDYVSSVSCDSDKGADPDDSSHTFTVAAGDQVTCTITNSRNPEIRVIKDLVPASDPGTFDLEIDDTTFTNGGNGYGDGGTTGFQQVTAGSHTVDEVAHTGTDGSDYLSSVSCDSGKGSNATGSSHTFSVAAGDQVTCTITNSRRPEIRVIKDLVPASDPGTFDLEIDDTTFTNGGNGYGDGGTTGFQQVTAGSHTVDEVAHTGTDGSDYLSSVSCDSGKGSNATGSSHTFSVAAGDQVTCTITNSRRPEIRVIKDLVPASDPGTFDLEIDDTTFTNGGNGYGDGGTTGFQQVTAGSHTVDEVAHTGTDGSDYLSSVSCDSGKGSNATGSSHTFSVAAGDQVTCTITNSRRPEIRVIKDLVPASDPGTFDLEIDDTTFTNGGNGYGDGGTTGFQQVTAGSHTVDEVAHTGTDGSDYLSSVSCDSGKGSNATGSSHTFSVAAGDQVTCTITNSRRPEIRVIKDLVPASDPGTFDLEIDDTTFTNGGNGYGDGGTTGFQQVTAGSHTVDEVAHTGTDGSDYLSSVSCDSGKGSNATGSSHTFSVAAGDQVTCTITNSRRPEIRVIKDLVPASDPGTFDLEIDDTTFTNGGNGYGDGGTTGFQQVTAGSHTVDEVAHTGTDGSDYLSSVSCDSGKGSNATGSSHTFSVAAGDQVTCTITNSRRPEIRVIKDLVPASDPGTFDLEIDDTTFTNGGNGYGDGGTTGFQQVTAGSHTVDEVAHTGTDGSDYLSSVSCDSGKGSNATGSSHTFSVAAGDQVTCTITNSRRPEIRVIKDLVPASDPGTFDLEIDDTTFTNGGNGYGDGGTTGFQQVTAGSHTVDEVAHTGTDGSDYLSSVSCDSGKGSNATGSSHTFSVAAGDQVTCTITNSRQPPPPGEEPVGLVAPSFQRTANLEPLEGIVLIKLPGSNQWVEIQQVTQVPMGTTVDVSNGHVLLITQKKPSGGLQSIELWAGAFVLQQKRKRNITVLTLASSFAGAVQSRAGAETASLLRRGKRQLWGRGKCRCRHRGRNSAGTSRGTWWLTAERPEGTLTKVKKGKVEVRDFKRRKKVLVKAGEKYLARD